uniref:Uncharacterized protein n=1 Tax=viral metagenome TaxID=1070528 RepID=A0A6C0HMS9_9ZZZZ
MVVKRSKVSKKSKSKGKGKGKSVSKVVNLLTKLKTGVVNVMGRLRNTITRRKKSHKGTKKTHV